MTIQFHTKDRELVAHKLKRDGITVNDRRIDNVLYNVEAALLQQFDMEADFMIDVFEADQ